MFCCRQQKSTKNVPFFFIFAFQDLQNSVPCLLTWISFFYIKFANFWYITCPVPNLIPILSWVYGLTSRREHSKSNNVNCILMIINQKQYSTPSKLPQLLLLNFSAKFLTERMNKNQCLTNCHFRCLWLLGTMGVTSGIGISMIFYIKKVIKKILRNYRPISI